MALVILLAFILFWLPPIVAKIRNHPNRRAIFVLNLFLGWTGFGWIGAMVWAMTSVPKPEPTAAEIARARWRDVPPTLERLEHLRRPGESFHDFYDRMYSTREPISNEEAYSRLQRRFRTETHARIRAERTRS